MRSRPLLMAASVALLFALAARLPFFLRSDFPLNDGGLFYTMARDILAAGYALPAFASYNSAAIPFAYPPLSLYLLAAVTGATGVDPLVLVRYLPLLANLGTVAAVAFLARSLLGPGRAAFIAPAIFAVLPRSYEWMVMGGGLTRSTGLLFAVLSLALAPTIYERSSAGKTLACGILAAAALAAHMELGLFVLLSLLLMALVQSHTTRALLLSYGLALMVVLLTAPWWATVISRHGLTPFEAASLTSYWSSLWQSLDALGGYAFPSGLLLSVVGVSALLGTVVRAARGELFLPIWLAAIFVAVPRSAETEGAIPLALLAAVGLVEVAIPGLVRGLEASRASLFPMALSVTQAAGRSTHASRLSDALGLALLLAGVFIYSPQEHADPRSLDSLSAADRQVMSWASQNTPQEARFLVLSTTWAWETDRVGEWFPVIAQRQSVLTPQGSEWLPSELFVRKVSLFYKVREIAAKGKTVDDLDEWARGRGIEFSYVHISKEARGTVDWSTVVASAKSSPNYRVLVDNPSVALLQRTEPLKPLWSPSGQLLVARDGQSLAEQPVEVQAAFARAYGQQATWTWVEQHDRSLGTPATVCDRLERAGLGRFGIVRAICRDEPSAEPISVPWS